MESEKNIFPGYNCKQCGYDTCQELTEAIYSNKSKNTCIFHSKVTPKINKKLRGIIVDEEADFSLEPLNGESSCRETILPFSSVPLSIGDVIRYRPLGCPVVHFGKIIDKNHLLVTIHLVGPRDEYGKTRLYKDVGVCMVCWFEGRVIGEIPEVCQTVKFIPHKCMMQKVHAGVVTHVEGRMVRIDGIDLKIWGKA